MKPAIHISVVIPTYDREKDLHRCLTALAPQLHNGMEVIVTDDFHSETIRGNMTRAFPWATWVSGPQRGPAANRNHGVRQSSGTWIVFTDDDCTPAGGFISNYEKAIEEHPGIKIFEGSTKAMGQHRSFAERCPENVKGGKLYSCNFCIQKDLFWEIGGFDEIFPYAAGEDSDFHYQITLRKDKTLFVDEARVFHPWQKNGYENYKRQYISFGIWVHKNQRHFKKTTYCYMLYANALNHFRALRTLLEMRGRGLPHFLFYSKYAFKHYGFILGYLLGIKKERR